MQPLLLFLVLILLPTSNALSCYMCNPEVGLPEFQWLCNYTQGEVYSVLACNLTQEQRDDCLPMTVPSFQECWVWAYVTPVGFQGLPLPPQADYPYSIWAVEKDIRQPGSDRCFRQMNETYFLSTVQYPYNYLPICTCNSDLCNGEMEFQIFHSPSTPHPSSTTPVITTVEPSPPLGPVEQAVHISAYIIPSVLLALLLVVVCIGAALKCWCNAVHRQNNLNRTECDFPKDGDVMADFTDISSMKKAMLRRGQQIQVQELSLTVVEMVGMGRFGTVWKAVDQKGLAVAVKVFGYKDEPSWRNERHFYRMPSISHPHVLEYIASSRKGSDLSAQYYMASSYCPYGALNKFLVNHTISWNVAINIIGCITSALAHLHGDRWINANREVVEKSPIAHRDIKSSNVLLTSSQGDCVLSDFGLALELTTNMKQLELANSGQVGTYRYMAPEALDAHVNLSNTEPFKQIDVYALALVIWEVVTVCETEEVHPSKYQLPFQDMVGERPTLDAMRQVVVANQRRPAIPDSWRSQKDFQIIAKTIEESWDTDPDARLTVDTLHQRVKKMYPPHTSHTSTNQSREQEVEKLNSTSSSPPLSEIGGVAAKNLL